MGTGTVYNDSPYTVDGHTIRNADLSQHGNVTIRYALEQSLNTVAAQVVNDIGAGNRHRVRQELRHHHPRRRI